MDKLTLSPNQIDQLHRPMTFVLLAHFKTAKTPSELAQELALPANTVHYHVKRLLEAGLLKVAEQKGRARKYQATAYHFRIPKRDWPQYEFVSTEAALSALKRLEQQFQIALEQSSARPSLDEDPEDRNYLLFELKDSFLESGHTPHLHMLEVSLSEAQYQRYSKALASILDEAKAKPQPGTLSTFAVIAFQGRSVSNCTL